MMTISLLTSSGPSLWTIMGLLKVIVYLLCFVPFFIMPFSFGVYTGRDLSKPTAFKKDGVFSTALIITLPVKQVTMCLKYESEAVGAAQQSRPPRVLPRDGLPRGIIIENYECSQPWLIGDLWPLRKPTLHINLGWGQEIHLWEDTRKHTHPFASRPDNVMHPDSFLIITLSQVVKGCLQYPGHVSAAVKSKEYLICFN